MGGGGGFGMEGEIEVGAIVRCEKCGGGSIDAV